MCRWEDNIKMDLREMGSEGVDWIELRDFCKNGTGFGFLGSIKLSNFFTS
jgi:hypothetical protein